MEATTCTYVVFVEHLVLKKLENEIQNCVGTLIGLIFAIERFQTFLNTETKSGQRTA